jgi:ATP phosphoribosyltransferase
MTGREVKAIDKLIFAVPSKGRLMEQTTGVLARAGLTLRKVGNARGYRGQFDEMPDVEVAFVSASEIAAQLKTGAVHFGVTGEDLVRELIGHGETQVELAAKLGFGHADVVVAVPDFWIDVRTMADLDGVTQSFRRHHDRRLRVATKYVNITRRYFAANGLTGYRIVESLGATEGTPASGAADLIVDITSTGETLKANGLRILDDGIILRSEANLVIARTAPWNEHTRVIEQELRRRLGC